MSEDFTTRASNELAKPLRLTAAFTYRDLLAEGLGIVQSLRAQLAEKEKELKFSVDASTREGEGKTIEAMPPSGKDGARI